MYTHNILFLDLCTIPYETRFRIQNTSYRVNSVDDLEPPPLPRRYPTIYSVNLQATSFRTAVWKGYLVILIVMPFSSWTTVLVDKCDSYFGLTARGTTVATEVRAGTASFLTLSYLLLVNPQILQLAGVPHDTAVFATASSAAVACFILGLGGNLPFGCAPGLGLSAYLTFGLVQADLCSLDDAMQVCAWSGIVVLAIAGLGGTTWLMRIVPESIKLAIVVGMGLLIAMIGLVSVGLIQANPKTLVELGNVGQNVDLQLCLAGILLVASLLHHNIQGAILIGISVMTIIYWTMHNAWPSEVFDMPTLPTSENSYWQPLTFFDTSKASVLLPALGAFVLICIFDISGVIFGLATLGGIMTESGEIPGSQWAFYASGVGTLMAAWTGSTPIIVCVETAAGVKEGGRTGLTAVVVGLYFCASLFLSPLFEEVPELATAPVLVLVGVMMMQECGKIPWHAMNDALPAFLTILLMPLTYSITNGMIFGLLAAAGFYFTTGQFVEDAQLLTNKLSRSDMEQQSLITTRDQAVSYGTTDIDV